MASKKIGLHHAFASMLLAAFAVLFGASDTFAMSAACNHINQDWASKTVRGFYEREYLELAAGETITYFARTALSQINGGNGFYLAFDGLTRASVEGNQTEEKEINGSIRVEYERQPVGLSGFSNPDTSVFVRVSCEGNEPRIESITPSLVKASETNQITINGRRFSGALGITIGGVAMTNVHSMSDEQITIEVPARATGTFDVVVTTSQGASEASPASKLTFASEPGAPAIGTVVANGTKASVAFTAPASNGGTAILDYSVLSNPGNLSATGKASPIEVEGIVPGTSYTFTVTARNAIGTGAASAASAPLLVKMAQSISFPAPSPMEFGSSGTLAATASSGLAVLFATSTPAICSVDANGNVSPVAPGSCEVTASQAGDGTYDAAPSVTQTLAIVPALPGAPAITGVTAGNGSATVTLVAPAFTGGASIDLYRVTASPGGAFVEGATSPLTVTGLTNGVSYTFTATARTVAGAGAASAASGAVVPQAPQSITLSDPGPVQLGSTITITGTASSGLPVTFASLDQAVCTIDAIGAVTLISPGTCSIIANQPGNAAFLSAPTATRNFAVQGVAPAAPTVITVSTAPGEASVGFTAPTFTGGTPIAFYTVHVSPGGRTVTGNASPIVVTGLSNGTSYSFAVTATNGTGTSVPSPSSTPVTPRSLQTINLPDPGPVRFGDTVTINASASSGLTVSLASATPAICTVDAAGSVTLLAPGTCSIVADQAGNAAFEAAPRASISFPIDSTVPGAPTNVTALAGRGQAEISFTPPSFDGGSAVIGYSVMAFPGGNTATGGASPITVPGLRNGTSYHFVVTATNAVGPGATSAASNPVTPQDIQTIGLTNPGRQIVGATLTLSGSASSGLPVSFASNSPGICTATPAGTVTTLAAGQCIISASQAGDAAYLPAAPVTQTFDVALTQLSITPPAGPLTAARMGQTYMFQLSASGQSGALRWSLTSGQLPAGLVLDSNSGTITGTASVLTTSAFELTVSDLSGGGSASANYSIDVLPREISAPPQTIVVPSGTVPTPLDLSAGAIGGPFTNAAILGVEPVIAGSASITAGASVMLDFTPNPRFTGQAIVRYTLTSALGTSVPLSVTYILAADLARIEAELTEQRDQFVQSRSSVWAASLSIPTFHDRLSAMGASTPGSISVTPTSGNSMTLAYAASTQAPALNAAESLASGEVDASGLRFWIDGTNTIHVRSGNAGEQWGSAATLSLGADMLAAENLLLGLSVHADWTDMERGSSKSSGTGLAAGPYVSVELAENLYFDASLLYGQSWNDMTDDMFAASFGTTRLLAKAGLQGRVAITDDLTLTPGFTLFYLREAAAGYVAADRSGTQVAIAPLLLEQLRATAGSTLRYRLVDDSGWSVQPYLGFELGTALSTGAMDYSASFSGGVDLQGTAGLSLGVASRLQMQSNGTTAISAQTRLGMRF